MLAEVDLRRTALFEDLTDHEVEVVRSLVEYRLCPAETTIVSSGTEDRSLFIIYSGSVRIVKHRDDRESPIAEVLPGEHLGEVTFVDGGHRTATAITNEPSELLVIEPRRFRELADSEPRIAFQVAWSILQLLARRLRNTDFWLFELMELGAERRGRAQTPAPPLVLLK